MTDDRMEVAYALGETMAQFHEASRRLESGDILIRPI